MAADSLIRAHLMLRDTSSDAVNALTLLAGFVPGSYTPTPIGTEGTGAISANLNGINLAIGAINSNITALQTGVASAVPLSYLGANNGVATLDSGGKIPFSQLPASVLEYKGTWDASTNTPTLSNSTGVSGYFYIVSAPGTQNLGSGNISFNIGDWVIHNGTVWQCVVNSNLVSSVNGQTGTVVLTTANISEGSNLYFTTARAQTAITVTGPLSYTFGNISIPAANTSTSGYLNSTDWNTFNDKEPAVTAGSSAQYYRGDKSFQMLDTSVVPEMGNLYFTSARAAAAAPVQSVAGRTGAVVLTSSDVGLGNVNNTSDLNKPISTATQAALNTLVAQSFVNALIFG